MSSLPSTGLTFSSQLHTSSLFMSTQASSRALTMSMIVAFAVSRVLATIPGPEFAYFKDTLEKNLDGMTCKDRNPFIEKQYVLQNLNPQHGNGAAVGTVVTVSVDSKLEKEMLDNCTETKQLIRKYILQSLVPKIGEDLVTSPSMPASCVLCQLSFCLNVPLCEICCSEGIQAPCFSC